MKNYIRNCTKSTKQIADEDWLVPFVPSHLVCARATSLLWSLLLMRIDVLHTNLLVVVIFVIRAPKLVILLAGFHFGLQKPVCHL